MKSKHKQNFSLDSFSFLIIKFCVSSISRFPFSLSRTKHLGISKTRAEGWKKKQGSWVGAGDLSDSPPSRSAPLHSSLVSFSLHGSVGEKGGGWGLVKRRKRNDWGKNRW